ncbi:MAG: BBE domain-containing protein [Pseudonocardia sp.]|nr:BBE domain-containing protein [Pseudonocardia sp.]
MTYATATGDPSRLVAGAQLRRPIVDRRDPAGPVRPRRHVNFPDPALDDWAVAHHAGNHPRLAAVKNASDPHRFSDFPPAI